MSELRKSATADRVRPPYRTTVWTVASVVVVLFIANLGALIDAVLHPDIGYFDLEHWIVGMISALVVGIMIAIISVYIRRIERTLQESHRAQDALRASESSLRAIFENSRQSFMLIDRDRRVQMLNRIANERAKAIYGRDIHLGDLIYQVIPPENQAGFEHLFEQALAGESIQLERSFNPGGLLRQYEYHIAPIHAENGSVTGVFLSMIDITDRKQAEAALRESEERFRLAFDTSPDAININRLADGLFVDINQGFTALTGFTRRDTIGQTSLEINIWHDPADRQRLVTKLQATGYCENLEAQFRRKDGSLTTALMSARVVSLQGVPHILSITRDITERKRAEEALQDSEERFRGLFEGAPDAILLADPATGTILDANSSACRLLAKSRAEIVGGSQDTLHPPQTGNYSKEIFARHVKESQIYGYTHPIETAVLRSDGTQIPVEILAQMIRLRDRTVLMGTFRDITDRKRAEKALRESEQRLRAVIDNAPFGAHLYELGPDRRLVFSGANRAADSILGVDHQPFVGRTIEEAFPPLSQTDIPDAYRRVAATGERYDAEQVDYAEGSIRGAFEVHAIQTGLNRMAAFFRDVTERKRAEQAEREARQLAEALRDTATALNTSLELDDVLERALINVRRVVPHDGANILLVDGDVARVVRVHGRCRAETVDTERHIISATPNLCTMRATGEPCIIDYTRDNPNWEMLPGQDWIASYAGAPIYAAGDQLLGYLGLYSTQPGHFSDEHIHRLKIFAAQAALAIQNAQLHTRIQAYSEELEERVRQRTRQLSEANARLAELDRLKDDFISRISHELRTPLTSIKIYLELLEAGKPEKRPRYIQVLNEQSDRLQQLIESLLSVTQQGANAADLKVAPVDLKHVIESLAADVAPRAAQRGLTFKAVLATGLPFVSVDAILLAQALTNVVTNALNYTPAGGTIDLATAHVIDRDESWITVTIHDTGPGIAPDELPHIFDRFYRGRAAADYKTPGAGVGLFISHDILTALGGRLTVDSRPGSGATFTAWLRPA